MENAHNMAEARKEMQELDFSNSSVDWMNWKRNFLVYMIANGKNVEPENKKIAIFLWLIGTKGANIYNTLFPNDGSEQSLLGTVVAHGEVAAQQRTLVEVLTQFDEYCLPQKNVAMESYKFNNMVQKDRQTFSEFLTELRMQLERCEFTCTCTLSYEQRMLRDRIITGVFDKKLQLKLLDEKNAALNRVVDICKTFESANVNKIILDSKKQVVAAIESSEDKGMHSVKVINKRFCFNCGGDWTPEHKNICPAKDFTCQCGKKGHFRRMCRKKNNNMVEGQRNQTERRQVNSVNWADMAGKLAIDIKKVDHTFSFNNICRINSIESVNGTWTKAYQVGKKIVTFKIDTGSDVNCIPLKIIKNMNINMNNEQNDFPVFDYSNNKIKIFGIVKLDLLDMKLKVTRVANFIVVDDALEPILGRTASKEFGLIKRLDVNSIKLPELEDEFVIKNNDIFNGIGKFPEKVTIQLKEGAKPVLHYKKRFPNAIIKKLKSKLSSMLHDGIISEISHPTDWVNNLQVVEKSNGELRICLDPKPLNACIQREHFLIPTINDFTSELCDKQIFTVLDCSNGFWQMELDDKSSELTTFMTPFGRYKFNRLPFGLNCAPEIFQRIMVKIFGDIPGVLVYFDDIGIAALDEAEHDRILTMVIERARLNNIKFNPEKIQYRKSEVKFMGNIICGGTIKPMEKYKAAILEMGKPKDKHGVMRLLGMFKYLARFIPNLSKITAELRILTGKNVPFEWNEKHDEELRNLFEIITSEPILAAYDPEKPVIIQTDASKDGLGSVLIQNGRPVAFASRTLSKSEQKWAQIEKELLAIVFACQRFHYFVYGREFVVESDHKPLETLMKRDIDDVTSRLQRMFMALLKYPKAEVVYKPGKSMLVADCLSRAQLPEISELAGLSGIIHAITKSVCLSEDNYIHYKQILDKDENYKRICGYVENGWPGFHQVTDIAQKFYKLKSELHFENGLLFVNDRLVIPTELQRKITKWLHEPHLGIEKTLARARMLYFWPGMNSQIREMITSCNVCEKFKRNNQKEPLVQEQNPRYPFHIVSMDLFEYAGHDFIAIIDAYSNYLIAAKVNNKTSNHIIDIISRVFNVVGYPSIVKSDNSPFNSNEFVRWADNFNIQIKYSSPRYPQSNGLAEKGVAIAKNILKRCYEMNEVDQFQYRILEYNTTPIASMGFTASELFFGRLIKTKLPVSERLLIRNSISEESVQNKITIKKERQKYYYDRNAKSLPSLQVEDLVIFKKNGKEWHYGIIVGTVNDRSYIIRDSFNNHFRRNRRFIAKTKNKDFNASELLFEENIKLSYSDNLSEIQVVRPFKTNVNIEKSMDNVIVEEPELSVEHENNHESSEYETAGSEASEASSDSDNEVIVEHVTQDDGYKTRSGRSVRAPTKYGW